VAQNLTEEGIAHEKLVCRELRQQYGVYDLLFSGWQVGRRGWLTARLRAGLPVTALLLGSWVGDGFTIAWSGAHFVVGLLLTFMIIIISKSCPSAGCA
jgi:hypothetical protein